MVKVAVLKLDDPNNRNRWVIGTPEAVPIDSPFFSEQLELNHITNPDRKIYLENEKKHYHKLPIEEFYFVLKGILKVEIEDTIKVVKKREILTVPSEKCHKVKWFSKKVEFIVFRSPSSSDQDKVICE